MSTENEKWSSVEEVSEHLQVHKDTIRLWIKKGEIPAHKIGRLWRFKISEIDEWVRSGKSADINKGTDKSFLD
jgi:excisionase family DNA binding protein